jgi:hypothetical protein
MPAESGFSSMRKPDRQGTVDNARSRPTHEELPMTGWLTLNPILAPPEPALAAVLLALLAATALIRIIARSSTP